MGDRDDLASARRRKESDLSLSTDRLSGFVASLFAASAMLGADAAVLVHAGVLLALLGADATRHDTGLHRSDDDLLVAAGSAGTDGAGREAQIGAIEVQSDALPQLVDHVLGEASVCARNAGLRTGIAFLNAADQRVVGVPPDIRVCGDHFSHVMHEILLTGRRLPS